MDDWRKSNFLREYHRNGSITLTQREIRTSMHEEQLTRYEIFKKEGNFQNRGTTGNRARISRRRNSLPE